jgi:hypothetical protein
VLVLPSGADTVAGVLKFAQLRLVTRDALLVVVFASRGVVSGLRFFAKAKAFASEAPGSAGRHRDAAALGSQRVSRRSSPQRRAPDTPTTLSIGAMPTLATLNADEQDSVLGLCSRHTLARLALTSDCLAAAVRRVMSHRHAWRTSRSVHSANYPCSLVPLSALREQEFAELVISVSLRLELAALEPFFAACFAATPATQLVYRCMGRAIASSLRRGRFTTELLLALRELPYAQYMHPPPAANATEAIVEGMKLRDWVRPFVASASAVDALEVLRHELKMWVCRDSWRHALVAVFSSGSSLSHAWAMSDDDARLCGWAASALGLAVDEVRSLVVDLALDEPLEFEAPPRLHRSREEIEFDAPTPTHYPLVQGEASTARVQALVLIAFLKAQKQECRAAVAALVKALDERAGRLAALQLAGDFELDERLAAASIGTVARVRARRLKASKDAAALDEYDEAAATLLAVDKAKGAALARRWLRRLERRLPGLWVSAIVAALLLLNGALLVLRGLTAREYWMWASGVVAVVLLLGPDLVG